MSNVAKEVLDFDPNLPNDWSRDALVSLKKIVGKRKEYKRALILKVVRSRLSGIFLTKSLTSVEYEDYFYFRSDPLFVTVLNEVSQLATVTSDQFALDAITRTQRLLAVKSTKALETAVAVLASEDERVRLQAAFGLLDRAGVATAQKQSIAVQTDWQTQAKSLGLDPTKLLEALVVAMMQDEPQPLDEDQSE